MTCYNVGPYVEEALSSCLKQEYQGLWELIIVNDCSTDQTKEIIERMVNAASPEMDITVIHHSANMGVAGATDSGFRAAKYDWIIMVDGDDIQFPDRCAKTARLIQDHPDAGLIVMSAENIRSSGEAFGYTSYCQGKTFKEAPDLLYIADSRQRILNWMGRTDKPKINAYGCAMALKRCLVELWGNLQQPGAPRIAQDPPWELRAFLSAPVLGSKELACHYRMHNNNILNRQWNYGTPQGLAEIELFQSNYQLFNMQTFLCMQRDLLRACQEKGLTTCTPEDLSLVREYIAIALNSCKLRAGWWGIPWPARLWRACRYRTGILASLHFWAWPRLLPLSLFCWLRRKALTCKARRKS